VYDRATLSITRASVRTNGNQGDGSSLNASISDDGRFVAFESFATNLVKQDTNSKRDVFVRDLVANTTTRVSVSSSGTQADDQSVFADISGSGNQVAFASSATNLVSGDTNGYLDVFVRNLNTSNTVRVSVKNNGGQATGGPSTRPSISNTGRYVAFSSDATNLAGNDSVTDSYVRDKQAGTTTLVSKGPDGSGGFVQGNGNSLQPDISRDGRYVAYSSAATNLWLPGDTNGVNDIYEFDMMTQGLGRLTVSSGELQAVGGSSWEPAVSSDGQYAVYQSFATNLVPDDTNGFGDIFTHQWESATEHSDCTTTRESIKRLIPLVLVELFFLLAHPPGGGGPDYDSRCQNMQDSPASPDPDTTTDEFVIHDSDIFTDVFNPTTGLADSVHLRWGRAAAFYPYRGWGYRHVKAKHGWGPSAKAIANTTLHEGGIIADSKTAYHWVRTYPGDGITCYSLVAVEFKQETWAPAPYGIITAYAVPL
jgi:Tol biopolymer transport system component